ncbi:uroporphyrinogen-III synthase [Sphingobium aquiterrae]|uniref:uroporphyrinogen-III synthase n=1 Tax=Sphingobium aquiterrae TaxID=2038656 RepID=UPI0030163C40
MLVLRPAPGNEASAAAAHARGLDVACYPLFHIAALPWTGPEPHLVDAVMITSANALRHGGPQLGRYTHLPAFAVGAATARVAREAGFAVAHVGTAGVQAVVDALAQAGHRAVLHLSGHNIRPFDPGALRVTSIPLYAAVDSGDAQGLAQASPPGTILLVHSPRAGRRLAALIPPAARAGRHVVAISPAALAEAGDGWASAHAAVSPDDNAMLALAAGLCE